MTSALAAYPRHRTQPPSSTPFETNSPDKRRGMTGDEMSDERGGPGGADWLERTIDQWLRENMGDFMTGKDARNLARSIRATTEYKAMRQDHADLTHLLRLMETLRQEQNVRGLAGGEVTQ